ncbi:Protein furry -like protein-like [Halotydeus destructor]|nr:Protein furry -like protein-like [Halotydeus destructor]
MDDTDCLGDFSSSQTVVYNTVREMPVANKFASSANEDVKPGEFVLRNLFTEFTILAEKKIETVLTVEPLEKPLSKSLQRGEDLVFDQLLTAFGSVAENCLPSLLRTLFAWYEIQLAASQEILELRSKGSTTDSQSKATGKTSIEASEKEELLLMLEKRDLAIEFIFCLVLIEILKQLPLHPGHEDLISYVEMLAFKHFKYRESIQQDPNIQSINIVADLYAEVIGVLVQSRFTSVRKRFMIELAEFKAREPTHAVVQNIISLLMGMKFFRVKMVPIEDFEASFLFMHECATYFLEVKDKDIKHALAGLFVEILVPVSAVVKNEVNVPCLKNFVELLYPRTLDLCTKKKHMLALFPLVTCLLCVSQKTFFLQNWHYFLVMCLAHLKNRDPKMSRVALESLYRLLWVYMVRIKCESNSATQSRLQSIVNSLFPKGSKAVVPRDTPLNIFVKIIQFIAQERLDFAMKEIVFDLLSVGRPIKVIMAPERMSIGLRAFLVVADSLQQKEGEPPMPRTLGIMPSGNTVRVKKTFLNKMLTEEMARTIGVNHYHSYVKKALTDILKALDTGFGRPLMLTTMQNINKEPDEMITGERKPKIDLFRTCIAAIPRLIPDGMTRQELIDLLSRLTVHMDEEMRGLACQSLQNIVNDFPDWREDVADGFVHFLQQEVSDTYPHLLDNALRLLLHILTNWRQALLNPSKSKKKKAASEPSLEAVAARVDHTCLVLHKLEGFALAMLCSCRPASRRLASHILKEARFLLKTLTPDKSDESVADVIDKVCPAVVESCMEYIPAGERSLLAASSFNVDLQWLADRNGSSWVWASGETDPSKGHYDELRPNAWLACLMGFLSEVERACPSAVSCAWTIVCQRLNALYSQLDVNPISDNRASALLRGASSVVKKNPNEKDGYLNQWKSYLMFTCKIAPTSYYLPHYRGYGFDVSSSPESVAGSERSCDIRSPQARGPSPSEVFRQILPLLRSEQQELRNAAVLGLSYVNSLAIKDLMEEVVPYIRDVIDRKQENRTRRRRREMLRLQLGKLLELIATKQTFGSNQSVERDSGSLNSTFVEYIDGMRICLETDVEKDPTSPTQDIKLTFGKFITELIKSFKLENRPTLIGRDTRRNLFYLFSYWTGKLSSCILSNKRLNLNTDDIPLTEFEFVALKAMSSVLCCGPVFDAQILAEDSNLYHWIEALVGSKDERLNGLGQETIIYLLEHNPDTGSILDWIVDCCYTKPCSMADVCFTAMATVFCLREYPCDHYVSIINVTLMNVGSPRISIHQLALQLLQVLDFRFFEMKANSVLTLNVEDTDPEDEDENDESAEPAVIERIQLRPKNSRTKIFEPLLNNMTPCNQLQLSTKLARLHPQLTMPIFSEVTCRLQTARPSVCKSMLECLIPWLYNMELVDPHVASQINPISAPFNPLSSSCNNDLPREGWGSSEATEMVLNNLLYVTVKFSDEYLKEIEDVWSSLSSCWPNNLRIITRYLFIVTGIAPSDLLPHTKRVALFMGRAKPDRFIDEMMAELQSVESFNYLIERTETPPFYRITSLRKGSGQSEDEDSEISSSHNSQPTALSLEQGTIHTKRHSTESGEKHNENGCISQSASTLSCSTSTYLRTDMTVSFHSEYTVRPLSLGSPNIVNDNVFKNDLARLNPSISEKNKPQTPQPHPLPMPEFGGYYAPLTEYLPRSDQPIVCFHRCYLALMLMSDVVINDVPIEWTPHIPSLLHVVFLGMDHPRPVVHDHCRQFLLLLLIACGRHGDDVAVARVLIQNKCNQLGYGLTFQNSLGAVPNFTEPPGINRIVSGSSQASRQNSLREKSYLDTFYNSPKVTVSPNEKSDDDLADVSPKSKPLKTDQLVKLLIDFLANKQGLSLWNSEDITAKVWTIRSAEQMAFFLEHILHVFCDAFPGGHIEERWAEVALQLALSCSSRHYAGRSLQIFRALKVPVNSRMMSDILSRLVETVAEQGEDMQGYVTELMLTLEAAVDSLDMDKRAISMYIRDLFKSTPNLEVATNRKSAPAFSPELCSDNFAVSSSLPTTSFMNRSHARSTSYTVSISKRTADLEKDIRNRSSTETSMSHGRENYAIGRSRSVQSLSKITDDNLLTPEDRTSLLAQFFWIALAMLETDYEHEFLLAVRLLDRTLAKFSLDKTECQEKVEKILIMTKWANFPGLHTLLIKGCTSGATYEPTINLLHKLTLLLEVPIIDASDAANAFPFNVMAILPYMVANYEEPNAVCIKAAENFAQWCSEKSSKLENLATVMTLYSRRSFSKECFQWTKCVVKYLYDAYSPVFLDVTSFLVDVMDKGPSSVAAATVSILHCILHYIDITYSKSVINADINKVVSKYIEGPQWKDALKIIKLIVSRSSTLVAAPAFNSGSLSGIYGSIGSFGGPLSVDCISIASGASGVSGVSFNDTESGAKRELPGRTMEFSYDMSCTPVIGRRILSQLSLPEVTLDGNKEETRSKEEKELPSSPRRSFSCNHSYDNSNWKKPWLSQSRTRERLVALLTTFGQRVGLPKSPSVIFSQSSDIMDRQSSVASSTDDVSATNNDASADSKLEDATHGEFGLFKDFDFLEYELESQEGEGMDNFNWGVRRRSLSNLGDTPDDAAMYSPVHSLLARAEGGKDLEGSSDEDAGSVSPMFEAVRTNSLKNHQESLSTEDSNRPSSVLSCSSSHSLVSDADA